MGVAGQQPVYVPADAGSILSSSSLRLQRVAIQTAEVWCDISTGSIRPVIPADLRKAVFDSVHTLIHPGVCATIRLVKSRSIWPGLAADIKEGCRECAACQRAKVTAQPSTPVEKIDIPQQHFSQVHVDLVGPLPSSRVGHRYLLTVIDRSTRWCEAIPLGDITAEVILEAFISGWVARFFVPQRITSDRGAQLTSGMWTEWCQQVHVEYIKTTAFHPQSNGMVERLHRQLKDALRARGAADQWEDHLPWVLLGLRAVPKDKSGVSVAEAALGQQLKVPGQATHIGGLPTAQLPPAVIPGARRSYAEVVSNSASALESAEWVYVRKGGAAKPLADNYEGTKAFKLQMGERVDTVSRDRLKAHLAAKDPEPAVT